MSADPAAHEAARDLSGPVPGHQAWTVASISRNGTRMLLVDADGNEMSVAVAPDALPRRSERTTVNQPTTPTLRPRDIQARIRAGESPESVAEAAGTTLERIMPFAAPVMAEREHIADRAQKASVRRQATDSTARTLGDAVAVHLAQAAPEEPTLIDTVEWDAWRRHDGRWSLVALYTAPTRAGAAEFTYDPPGSYVALENDDARWLVGDLPEPPAAPASAAPSDDLTAARERREAIAEPVLPTSPPPSWTPAPPAPVVETTAPVVEERAPELAPAAETPGAPDTPAAAESTEQPTAPRKAKRRGRASIPSWDEIMFGGGDSATSATTSDSEDTGKGSA